MLIVEVRFRVDGGKPPGIRLIGNPRRSRILLAILRQQFLIYVYSLKLRYIHTESLIRIIC